MERYEIYMLALKLTWLAFVFAFGACIGSLINVLAYRMPRGIGVVTPPSSCPKCGTRLSWRDNLPIIGWLMLRGRCRYCSDRISPEYPLVEAFVATLFAAFFALWFLAPDDLIRVGMDRGAIKPDWLQGVARMDQTVPFFVMILLLVGALTAMTIIDAKTCTIPLALTWVPAALGLLTHLGTALYVQFFAGGRLWARAPGHIWMIPTPVHVSEQMYTGNWPLIGASFGGVIGIGVGALLLWSGHLRRSFADYAEWEAKVLAESRSDAPIGPGTPGESAPGTTADAERWIQYPHARREMRLEVLFLAPCLGLAMAGWYLGKWYGPTDGAVSLWVAVLAGVCLGYLVGGGVVWLVRIAGSLVFGKEAMGLGDVHMMAGVGACLGWIDATLAFFLAAFVGLGVPLVALLSRGAMRRTLPYGPCLAIATVLVLLGKPLIESFLSRLMHQPVYLP